MSLYKRNTPKPPVGVTEFEILKASHKFLRDDDEPQLEQSQALTTTTTTTTNADDKNATDNKSPSTSGNTSSWNDQLAAKYYASLYREFALCDLKHYKSGNFALRWRTEDEVLSGAGETTCGNTRCEDHLPTRLMSTSKIPPLTTLELPFGYVEHGKSKSALVKVVLCGRCLKKLMWKRNQKKERQGDVDDVTLDVQDEDELGGERREKEGQQKKVKSEREEGGDKERDQEKERERSGKSKRKREDDILSEAETERRSQWQLEEDQRTGERHYHDSANGTVLGNRREKNELSDRLGKRRRSRTRSRSHSRSRNDPSRKADRQTSSSQHRHRERR